MQIERKLKSADGITTKYVLRRGEELVETSYVDRPEKHIICFSTGAGCPMRCGFCCAAPFSRSLAADELLGQCEAVLEDARVLESPKPVLFSTMGEGETLVSKSSLAALSAAFATLQERVPDARFALATTAIQPHLLRQLAAEKPVKRLKLQLSLHGTTEEQRRVLIPVAASFPKVLAAGKAYEEAHPGEMEWNYVLVKGVNDSPADAKALAGLLGPGSHVKLNRLNPVPNSALESSSFGDGFAQLLRREGLTAEHYATDGVDIAAACGQLRSQSAPVQLGRGARRSR